MLRALRRSPPTDKEVVLASAERFIQSDDPTARLAGHIALLEPTGFDEKGALITPRLDWAFAHEDLRTHLHLEQGLRRIMRVDTKPRRFIMDAFFCSLEEGNGQATAYSASLSLGFMGEVASYGEVYVSVGKSPKYSVCDLSRHSEGAVGAQHIEMAEHMVGGVSVGLLTTENKFSQLIASILESSSGVPDEKLGARLDVAARSCLDTERRHDLWDML